MDIHQDDFMSHALSSGIPKEQAEKLWSTLELQASQSSKFNVSNIFYYLGAVIVISAMTWLMGLGWEIFGGGGILALALLYGALFWFLGHSLWQQTAYRTPGGLFITLAVCMIPLATYGFQRLTGLWPQEDPGQYTSFYSWIKGGWFMMELLTILGGCLALIYYRFPFLTAPIFFSLWFMSMDITPLLYPQNDEWSYHLWVSLWFGLGVLIVAYIIDQRTREDYAFWGYLFGMLSFWFGLFELMDSSSEIKKAFYALINLGLIFLSVLLQRRLFLVFGSLGVFIYLSTQAYQFFHDSALFPFVLSSIGIAIIFLGMAYNKYQAKIEAWIMNLLPESAQTLLPKLRKK